MKRISLLWLLGAAALVCATSPSSYAQEPQQVSPQGYFKAIPMKNLDTNHTMTPSEATQSVNAAGTNTVPLFSYSIVSPVDSNTYTGLIVGRSPLFHGARSTSVPTYLIPVIFKILEADGTTVDTYDPTAPDPSCSPSGSPLTLTQNSPVFQTSDIHMGGTDIGNSIYSDAFERGEFWSNVSITGNAFHTQLQVTTTSAVTVTVPAADGKSWPASSFAGSPCEPLGVLNESYLEGQIQTIITGLSSQGVGPTTIPLLLTHNVVSASSGLSPFVDCCALGFHSGYTKSGKGLQVYGISDYDTSNVFDAPDISILSHEVDELINDPNVENATPGWSGGQVRAPACQGNFEVGDPLTGTFFPAITMNSFTYHPQELAFFSWFYRQTPSLGVNGWYSDNGTFTSGAGAACTPN